MIIPTWLSIPLCIVLPWLSGALWYFAGKWSERRRLAAPSPPRVSYDITINFAGKPDDHPGFREQLLKTFEDIANKAPPGAS